MAPRPKSRTIGGHAAIWSGVVLLVYGLFAYIVWTLNRNGLPGGDFAQALPLAEQPLVPFVGGLALMGLAGFLLRKSEEAEEAEAALDAGGDEAPVGPQTLEAPKRDN